MAKKRGNGGVTGSLDSDIKRAEMRESSSPSNNMVANSMNSKQFRDAVKQNPFVNAFGLIPEDAIDNMINAGVESAKAVNAVVPEMVSNYIRSSTKTAARHAINANRQLMAASSKVLDNVDKMVREL